MHSPPRARHRDIKLCLVRLAERPNRHAGNDLVDSLGLAGVTGDSYSLIEMQSGTSANNLTFIEYDLAIINADHGPELAIEKLCPRPLTFFVRSGHRLTARFPGFDALMRTRASWLKCQSLLEQTTRNADETSLTRF